MVERPSGCCRLGLACWRDVAARPVCKRPLLLFEQVGPGRRLRTELSRAGAGGVVKTIATVCWPRWRFCSTSSTHRTEREF